MAWLVRRRTQRTRPKIELRTRPPSPHSKPPYNPYSTGGCWSYRGSTRDFEGESCDYLATGAFRFFRTATPIFRSPAFDESVDLTPQLGRGTILLLPKGSKFSRAVPAIGCFFRCESSFWWAVSKLRAGWAGQFESTTSLESRGAHLSLSPLLEEPRTRLSISTSRGRASNHLSRRPNCINMVSRRPLQQPTRDRELMISSTFPRFTHTTSRGSRRVRGIV
ncbi:hypothetical protein CH063_09834 [Colletotrichum higginsianum]|uniref:Uncharacterized protein n=1 Tax=Colletotrichum higginsianum (strain IMI 349063) TaxID=759273 RepID=H1VF15_COLHI|nr:hypothetical protein CH063_09834 [Colletotrichum higginsianum]